MNDDIVLFLVKSIQKAVTLIDDNKKMRVEVKFDEHRRDIYRIFFYTGGENQWFAETWADESYGYLRICENEDDEWKILTDGIYRWTDYPEDFDIELDENEAMIGRHICELNSALIKRYGTSRDETMKSIREFKNFLEELI